ncbi:uncharacterized protein J4E78_011050 [Alternaria triticimaculans]|uniref:uncharacterized protein n=1 Tax=Alternaria triticimaculans TaxID=297637 RepID=UPI0020C3ED69|nr:uncharacterized protein J4E78_011050 [Alternaria triticimaculans]KAI4638964.1 hypothetical protein J4E78_011050 [Alternaria triticimaculans]
MLVFWLRIFVAMSLRNTLVADDTASASSQGVASRASNLNAVPDDIHHLILSKIADTSPTDLLNVAQSSGVLHDAALPYIYRNIILNGESTAYKALVDKLSKDEHDDLTKHIRTITVKDEVPSADLITILNKTLQHRNLRSLNWETSTHITPAVYDIIHAIEPKPEIRVVVVDRKTATSVAHRQMDMKLLSSPLLVSLTYEVYMQGFAPEHPCRSEWPRLSQALAAGGNVRSLRLQVLQDGHNLFTPDTEPAKIPRLDLTTGMRLPLLEEMTLQTLRYHGQTAYLWDLDYCRMFRDAIDCSRLRKLDFGGEHPENFFTCFTGLCPKLKVLSFGMWEGDKMPARRFIESIDALEHLDLSRAQAGIDDLWPAIEQHEDTLETLILGPTFEAYCHKVVMPFSRLKDIARTFPRLKHLGWDAPCERNIDPQHLVALVGMNLTKLDLWLHIPQEANDYSEKLVQDIWGNIPHPELNKESTIASATGIADRLLGSGQGAFKWLTLHLSREGASDRCQPYMMYSKLQLRLNGRSEKTRGDKWDVRGKLDWSYEPTLMEDLLFEER